MNKPIHTIEHHTIRLSDSVTMRFCRIPGCPEGFLMGSRGYNVDEEPIHRVVIPEGFWMAETPVTQAQYDIWIQASGQEHSHQFAGYPDHPADSVRWNDAVNYCRWLTLSCSNQFPTGFESSELPCEAIWEYACRGNTNTECHGGDGRAALESVAWFGEPLDIGSTHRSGQKKPNAFGLFDMNGNVCELCLDRWDKSAYARRWDGISFIETVLLNEEFAEKDQHYLRTVRGGAYWSFKDNLILHRSAGRCGAVDFRSQLCGFRVCLLHSPLAPDGRLKPSDIQRALNRWNDEGGFTLTTIRF